MMVQWDIKIRDHGKLDFCIKFLNLDYFTVAFVFQRAEATLVPHRENNSFKWKKEITESENRKNLHDNCACQLA